MPRTCDLVRDLLPDLQRWARRLGRSLPRALEPDDLVQLGSIAVLKAAEGFDASLGDDVRVHCRVRAWRAMLDARRAIRSTAAQEAALALVKEVPVAHPDGGALAARRWLGSRVASLPGRHRRIVELRYGQDMDVREIGDRMGLSPARISQLHGEAIALLRAEVA